MAFPYINKGLLWKEWMQNRLYILIAFLIMSYSTFIPAMVTWFKQSGGAYYVPAVQWSTAISAMLADETARYSDVGASTMESLGVIVVVLLGIILLGEERRENLHYLLTLPVSRREIITTKFVLGAAAIIGIMLINASFMLICEHFLPALYSSKQVLLWTSLTGSAFLCMFSMAFMAATFTGNMIYAGIFTMIIHGVPGILLDMSGTLLQSLSVGSQSLLIRLDYIRSFFKIGEYLNGHRVVYHIDHSGAFMKSMSMGKVMPHKYPVEIAILFGSAVLFFLLAIKLFEKNPAERKGEILMFGNSKHIIQIGMAVFIGFVFAANKAYSPLSAAGFFIFYALLVYLMIAVIYFLQYHLGIGSTETR